MNLDKYFPAQSFTTAELVQIATSLTQPAVVKYFIGEQAKAFRAIANGLPSKGETDAEYLRRQAQVNGALEVWEALLSIEKPEQPES